MIDELAEKGDAGGCALGIVYRVGLQHRLREVGKLLVRLLVERREGRHFFGTHPHRDVRLQHSLREVGKLLLRLLVERREGRHFFATHPGRQYSLREVGKLLLRLLVERREGRFFGTHLHREQSPEA